MRRQGAWKANKIRVRDSFKKTKFEPINLMETYVNHDSSSWVRCGAWRGSGGNGCDSSCWGRGRRAGGCDGTCSWGRWWTGGAAPGLMPSPCCSAGPAHPARAVTAVSAGATSGAASTRRWSGGGVASCSRAWWGCSGVGNCSRIWRAGGGVASCSSAWWGRSGDGSCSSAWRAGGSVGGVASCGRGRPQPVEDGPLHGRWIRSAWGWPSLHWCRGGRGLILDKIK